MIGKVSTVYFFQIDPHFHMYVEYQFLQLHFPCWYMCQVNVSQKKNLVWNLIQIEEFPTWRNGCSYISPWTSLAYKKPVTLECFFLEYLEVKSRGDSTREVTKRETPKRWRARHNIQEATGRPDKMSVFVVDTYLPLCTDYHLWVKTGYVKYDQNWGKKSHFFFVFGHWCRSLISKLESSVISMFIWKVWRENLQQ